MSEYCEILGDKMNVVLGDSLVPLDGRFTTVRTSESNLCNLLCDVFRAACSADVVIVNSGTFRLVYLCVCSCGCVVLTCPVQVGLLAAIWELLTA